MLEMVAELTTGTVSGAPPPVLEFVTEPEPVTVVLTPPKRTGFVCAVPEGK